MKLALTGGTGFVGGHVLDVALDAGHQLRALTRRAQPERAGVAWVMGSLEDGDSLHRLVEGSDAVIHVAGVINGSAEAFERGNVAGTLAMLAAATAAGTTRFVHVSSLAAREPGLSRYGASKARSEELVQRSGLDWAIVRPPAVYGPGDRETLELFRMARLGVMFLPPAGRVSMIHAKDLARLLVALAAGGPKGVVIEPDDGRQGGWSHKEMARALGAAVGRKPVALSVPAGLLRAGAAIDQLLRRDKAKLTADRAAYFSHRDWVARAELQPPATFWSPQIPTSEGMVDTARWYRSEGWIGGR